MELKAWVWATHKITWGQQTRSNRADKTFHWTCYEKVTFEIHNDEHAINADLKNMLARLYDVIFFSV